MRRSPRPLREGLSALDSVGAPGAQRQAWGRSPRSFQEPGHTPDRGPRSSLNVDVGQGRRIGFVRQRLDELERVERRFGVTINDVLLAAVAGGLRAHLLSRGESVEGVTVQALVPVGLDSHRDHRLGNKVSAMFVRLPVGLEDPSDRLAAVAQAMKRCKDHRQALAGAYIPRWLDAWPGPALAAAGRLVHSQPFVNLVITNVPGPSVPLYMMGARMLEAFPIVPLAGNLSVGVAAFSYNGQLSVGILADRERCRDVDVLAAGIGASFAALVAAAEEVGERESAGAGRPAGPRTAPDGAPGARGARTGSGHRRPGAVHKVPVQKDEVLVSRGKELAGQ